MARLIPADKGTHYLVLSLIALGLLSFGWPVAVGVCLALAILREAYGRWRRARPMTREDWREAGLDIAFGMAGCAVVLLAARVGL